MYKVEIFKNDGTGFVSSFMTEETTITYDYFSTSASVLIAPPNQKCDIKNTVVVKDDDNFTVFVGFISSVERERTKSKVYIKPLMALLDEVSVINTYSTNYATQIYWQIYFDFAQPNPSLYRTDWRYVSPYIIANWNNAQSLYQNAPLMSDLKLIQDARRYLNKWMYFATDLGASRLGIPLYGFCADTEPVTVETDLDSVLSVSMDISTTQGCNIAQIWYPIEDGSYLHYDCVLKDDGTISYDYNEKYNVAIPRIKAKQVNENPSHEKRLEMFASMIAPTNTNYTIKMRVKKDYKLFPFKQYRVGQRCNVIYDGKMYETNLTAWIKTGDVVEYTFGTMRESLTDILLSEKGD